MRSQACCQCTLAMTPSTTVTPTGTARVTTRSPCRLVGQLAPDLRQHMALPDQVGALARTAGPSGRCAHSARRTRSATSSAMPLSACGVAQSKPKVPFAFMPPSTWVGSSSITEAPERAAAIAAAQPPGLPPITSTSHRASSHHRQSSARCRCLIGSERMRLPQAAKIALQTAGASVGTIASPTPPIGPPLRDDVHLDRRRAGHAQHRIVVEVALHAAAVLDRDLLGQRARSAH